MSEERTMIAACPHCAARYRIEPERLPAEGARLRCSRCEAVFRVNRPRSEPKAREVPPPAPAPPVSAPAAPVVAAPAAPAPTVGPRGPAARKPLVLVADPDVAAGKALAGALAGAGVEPILVHDGVEAVLTIQRTLPALVVLEASLPKMFGFQVCELMKRNEQLRSIAVVLVGAIHHRERYRRQASETYGADAYVERPELPDALLAILRRTGLIESETPRPAPLAPEAPRVAAERRPAPAPPAAAPPAPAPRPAAPARAPAAEPDLAADVARAERLARIIVSDIVLYNPERFAAAIRSGNVVEAMAAEMEEGRAHFRERIAERIRERKDFLGEELVRVARLRGMK
jgi:predicted Zn finger-like uncharacterized protein